MLRRWDHEFFVQAEVTRQVQQHAFRLGAAMRQEKQLFSETVEAQNDHGPTPLRTAAAMGLTKYFCHR